MKKLTIAFMILAMGTFFVSCGGGETEQADDQATTETVEADDADVAVDDAVDFSAGEAIYLAKCQVCHMEAGLGVANAFPPLAGSDYLLDDPIRAVKQVIHGSNEPMVVNGETYHAEMTPQVDTHQEAIDVINYVLNSWGNEGGILTLEDVKDIPLRDLAE